MTSEGCQGTARGEDVLAAGLRGRQVPDPDEAFARLQERWERGSLALREEERGGPDWWAELAERLGPDGAEFVTALEEHVNEQADRWGRDRFRLGYAVGASGLLEALDD
jgi:hypothetical protein